MIGNTRFSSGAYLSPVPDEPDLIKSHTRPSLQSLKQLRRLPMFPNMVFPIIPMISHD